MKRLRSMTDRAIVQLIAERCAAEAEGDDAPDLAAAVERRQKVEAADDDE